MDRLDAMALFVAIVDEGSFATAARKHGLSTASATRAVAMLEKRLGDRLLHRSTRSLHLTESGEHQLDVYRTVLAELARAEKLGEARDRIEGRISLTAPELFGQMKLMPVVETFLDAHPAVHARVLLLNRIVNLTEEGVDVAVRLATLPDSGLVAVKLGEMRRLICAAPTYLERVGRPATPGDLRGHLCIGTEDGSEHESWSFSGRTSSRARSSSVSVRPRLALTNAGAAINAAIRGHGLCRVMAYQVVEHIEAGRLVSLLDDFEPPPTPVHLVFHPIPRRNMALRAFVDHATPRLKDAVAAVARNTPRRMDESFRAPVLA